MVRCAKIRRLATNTIYWVLENLHSVPGCIKKYFLKAQCTSKKVYSIDLCAKIRRLLATNTIYWVLQNLHSGPGCIKKYFLYAQCTRKKVYSMVRCAKIRRFAPYIGFWKHCALATLPNHLLPTLQNHPLQNIPQPNSPLPNRHCQIFIVKSYTNQSIPV